MREGERDGGDGRGREGEQYNEGCGPHLTFVYGYCPCQF